MDHSAPPKQIIKRLSLFDTKAFLVGAGKEVLKVKKGHILFSQGDTSDAVFYILEGKFNLVVVSPRGREVVVAVLERGVFFGEACLSAQSTRIATAIAMGESKIIRIEKAAMIRMLHEEPAFGKLFLSHLLFHNSLVQKDLVDNLFESSERRLAQALLLLAHFGEESKTIIIPKVSQKNLADMIGITPSKVSFFMNKFEDLGFIDTNNGLHVNSSLLNIVLQD